MLVRWRSGACDGAINSIVGCIVHGAVLRNTVGGAKVGNVFFGVGEVEVDFSGSNDCAIEGLTDGF